MIADMNCIFKTNTFETSTQVDKSFYIYPNGKLPTYVINVAEKHMLFMWNQKKDLGIIQPTPGQP